MSKSFERLLKGQNVIVDVMYIRSQQTLHLRNTILAAQNKATIVLTLGKRSYLRE